MSNRPKIGKQIKRQLLQEAGDKCANPGCANTLVEFHHIQQWHLVRTHDPEHMIAICPACHDAVDRGLLRISDDTAYQWKQIRFAGRSERRTGHLYVEPTLDGSPRLQIGTITVTGDPAVDVFGDGDRHRLTVRVVDGEVMLVNVVMTGRDGAPLLSVRDGHVQVQDQRCKVAQRPGRFLVTLPVDAGVVPTWAISQVQYNQPSFGADGVLVMLDLEVLEPNLVRVEGIWCTEKVGFVASPAGLAFVADDGRANAQLLVGDPNGGTIVRLDMPPGSSWWSA